MPDFYRLISLALYVGAAALGNTVSACELETVTNAVAGQSGYVFVQEKTIPALSRVLISNGNIWLVENNTLIWHLQKPIVSTMVFSDSGIRQYDSQGNLNMRSGDPLFSEFSSVFIRLLEGDFTALKDSFRIEMTCDDDVQRWELTLEPVAERFAAIIKEITLSGGETLQSLSFEEQRGDKTSLQLEVSDIPPERAYLE